MSEVPLYGRGGTMQRFRGGLVFKAHRLVYHSTLGLRVIKKHHAEQRGRRVVVHRPREPCRLYRGTSLIRNSPPP